MYPSVPWADSNRRLKLGDNNLSGFPDRPGTGWAVSGPALRIGAAALQDEAWAAQTRIRLAADTARLDALMQTAGARLVGGTSLFRLYDVGDAQVMQTRLARAHIWSRIFPYSENWLRLGLPAPDGWARLSAALSDRT